MKTEFLLVCAAMVLSSIATQSSAGPFGGNRSGMNGPAENPPASFKEQQYVDSRGCVFLRAGDRINKVVWLPRLDNNLSAECGYQPTF